MVHDLFPVCLLDQASLVTDGQDNMSLVDDGRYSAPPSKRTKRDSVEEHSDSICSDFSWVSSEISSANNEGGLPKPMREFVVKSFNNCLSAEVRRAIIREYPRLNMDALTAPKVDKDIQSFLGKEFPAQTDKSLGQIQYAIATSAFPMLDLAVDLTNQGFTGAPDEFIPVKDVLEVTKKSISLIGNTFNYVNEARRKAIIQQIKPKRPRLASFLDDICKEDLGDRGPELFGPKVRTRVSERASTFKNFNESVAAIDQNPKPSTPATQSKGNRFLGKGSGARYGGNPGRYYRQPYPNNSRVYAPRGRGRATHNSTYHNNRKDTSRQDSTRRY